MARPLPATIDQWLEEILLAWKDARKAKPFAWLTGSRLPDTDLFHLAPLVCLKFRGKQLKGEEARRVTEGALANYVANSDSRGLESNPQLAFAVCYVGAHFVLVLMDEETANGVLDYCEKRLTI